MATYSSRGPTAIDGLLKPELVAPGNRIVAAAATGAYLTRTYPERVVFGSDPARYAEMSGSSMSAAVVSGSVALLLDAKPRLTPAQVKLALQVTSSRVAGAGLIEAGAGQVNVVAAVGLVSGDQACQPSGGLALKSSLTASPIHIAKAPLSHFENHRRSCVVSPSAQ